MYLFNTSLKGVNQITVSKDGIISKRFGFKKSYVWKDIRSITIKVVPHTNLPLGRSQTSPMCNGVTTEIDANPTNDLPLTLKIDEVFQLADRTYSIDASPVRADIVDLVRLTHGQKVAFTVIPPEEISPSDTDLCLQQGFLVNTAFVELKALFKSYGF